MIPRSPHWARTRLIELGRRLGALPAEIEGAQNEVDAMKRRLSDRERDVREHELELRIALDADENLKNDRMRDAAHRAACKADARLAELREALRAEDIAAKAGEAACKRMEREFRAAEMQVQIITDGILVLEAIEARAKAVRDAQPREEAS